MADVIELDSDDDSVRITATAFVSTRPLNLDFLNGPRSLSQNGAGGQPRARVVIAPPRQQPGVAGHSSRPQPGVAGHGSRLQPGAAGQGSRPPPRLQWTTQAGRRPMLIKNGDTVSISPPNGRSGKGCPSISHASQLPSRPPTTLLTSQSTVRPPSLGGTSSNVLASRGVRSPPQLTREGTRDSCDSSVASSDGQPPQALEPVPSARLNNYVFEAEKKDAASLAQGEADTRDDSAVVNYRFRCTYDEECMRLVTGNISMMCHAWAHVVQWKPTTEEVEAGHSDVDSLGQCPQCLARFPTPYRMQVHYTRAHSRVVQAVSDNTCAICEKEVKEPSLAHHLALHQVLEAPYRCSRCTYRCNLRLHLFDHVAQKHAGTGHLMCPFCTYSVSISLDLKRKRSVLHVRTFLSHMEKHEILKSGIKKDGTLGVGMRRREQGLEVPIVPEGPNRRFACDRCAQSFTCTADRNRHSRDHASIGNDKYILRRRKPHARDRRRSRLVMVEENIQLCASCRLLPSSLRPGRCALCLRIANNLPLAARRLITFSDGREREAPLRSLASSWSSSVSCDCGFCSRDGRSAAAHFYRCQRPMRVQLKNPVKTRTDNQAKSGKEEEEAVDGEKLPDEEESMLFALSIQLPVKVDDEATAPGPSNSLMFLMDEPKEESPAPKETERRRSRRRAGQAAAAGGRLASAEPAKAEERVLQVEDILRIVDRTTTTGNHKEAVATYLDVVSPGVQRSIEKFRDLEKKEESDA